MVAVTYGVARIPAAKNAAPARAPRQNIVGRFFTAVMEARLRQAYREIARREFLLANKRDLRGLH